MHLAEKPLNEKLPLQCISALAEMLILVHTVLICNILTPLYVSNVEIPKFYWVAKLASLFHRGKFPNLEESVLIYLSNTVVHKALLTRWIEQDATALFKSAFRSFYDFEAAVLLRQVVI